MYRSQQTNFTPAGDSIRFGLAAIKNVGHNAIESILKARDEIQADAQMGRRQAGFSSLWEFCDKVDLRLMNKRVLESLCKAGAMDSFGKRSQVMAALDKAMERAQKSQRDAAAGQHGLFGMFDNSDEGDRRPTRARMTPYRQRPSGTSTRGCRTKRKCWASLFPDIRSTSIGKNFET